MNETINIVSPHKPGTVRDASGAILAIPESWAFLEAGDPGVTRKVTAAGTYWRGQIRKGRRDISRGVWAPKETIENATSETEKVRSTDSYKKSMTNAKIRRDKKQDAYAEQFYFEVRLFLSFSECYKDHEDKMAKAITAHAIPVGSGTVARTETIPVEERAAKAVIAWMRHQTTDYDTMKKPRVKGKRREVRRMLAEISIELLSDSRRGESISPACPLKRAIDTQQRNPVETPL